MPKWLSARSELPEYRASLDYRVRHSWNQTHWIPLPMVHNPRFPVEWLRSRSSARCFSSSSLQRRYRQRKHLFRFLTGFSVQLAGLRPRSIGSSIAIVNNFFETPASEGASGGSRSRQPGGPHTLWRLALWSTVGATLEHFFTVDRDRCQALPDRSNAVRANRTCAAGLVQTAPRTATISAPVTAAVATVSAEREPANAIQTSSLSGDLQQPVQFRGRAGNQIAFRDL